MRPHIRLILCLLLPFAAAAQTQTTAPPVVAPPTVSAPVATPALRTPPPSDVPSDSNERARPGNYKACRDRVAAANASGKHIDLLFVGDSITEAWNPPDWGGYRHGGAVWDKYYANRNALNFGVGADRTQNVLYRLDTMDVQALTPKVIVLMIGTNNTQDTAPQIATGVHAVLAKLETMYPMAKIVLVSILPNARATQLMADANALIQPYADGKTVFYLDLVPLFPPSGDNWAGLSPDKLHPTEAGYQVWADAMEPLLTRLLPAATP